MADTSVKYFHSAMPGAPVLSGTAGALINVLDACLVNGFGVSAVASLVVAGDVATATISGGHSGEVGSVMTVAGATPSGLNGEKKLLSVGGGNTTLTFDATGIADQTATGSITIKVSGAGWVKAFSGTNLAAYQSGDVAATGCLLRVDDTGSKVARCVGYELMTGISAGSAPFPTAGQRSGGTYWTKSSAADSSSRAWSLAADDRGFLLAVAYHPTYRLGGALQAFGDLVPTRSGDAWSCLLSGYASDKSGDAPGDTNDFACMRSSADEIYLPRTYLAMGSAITAYKSFGLIQPGGTIGNASGSGPMVYPNAPDSGLYLTPLYVFESFQGSLRGSWPGVYCVPQTLPLGLFQPNSVLSAVENLTGRDLRAMLFGSGASNSGTIFADTTGPWR